MGAEEVQFRLEIARAAERDDRAGRPSFVREAAAAAFHLWQGQREELRRAYRVRLREFASLDARAPEAVVLERRLELDGFKRELWAEVWLAQNLTAPELVSLLSGPDEARRTVVFRVIESGQGAPFTFEERAARADPELRPERRRERELCRWIGTARELAGLVRENSGPAGLIRKARLAERRALRELLRTWQPAGSMQ